MKVTHIRACTRAANWFYIYLSQQHPTLMCAIFAAINLRLLLKLQTGCKRLHNSETSNVPM